MFKTLDAGLIFLSKAVSTSLGSTLGVGSKPHMRIWLGVSG
jgi:hypothetical protein